MSAVGNEHSAAVQLLQEVLNRLQLKESFKAKIILFLEYQNITSGMYYLEPNSVDFEQPTLIIWNASCIIIVVQNDYEITMDNFFCTKYKMKITNGADFITEKSSSDEIKWLGLITAENKPTALKQMEKRSVMLNPNEKAL